MSLTNTLLRVDFQNLQNDILYFIQILKNYLKAYAGIQITK